ncbi:zinc-dependent metalloprotease [Brooklawnia cerclae]|uniref:Hydrolase n=1 Tax=Brooklawnia cerclae TaxID=349934 RepID=A0ABX0SI22_9ACTN|nr:zinc-dependent metalloprotease [Brooklawnia cerclae]NIH56377.1 putative hydrolase [Brooklawnia cerclae]
MNDDEHEDPLAKWLAQFGFETGSGMDLGRLVSQLQQAMQSMSGRTGASGIDWKGARSAARQVVAGLGPDPAPNEQNQRKVAEADRLAGLWLDQTTSFDQVERPAAAWSRAEWVERTMGSWRTVAEPIVTRIADALASSFGAQFAAAEDAPAELGQLGAMLTPMLRGAAGSMYTLQLSQAIGQLAGEVVSGTELGLQVMPEPQVVLLPANIAAFGEGLGLRDEDVLLYLTVREAARQRLFANVGWLAPQLLAFLEHYAREITIDVAAITEAVEVDDPSALTPERLAEISEQLQGRLFSPTQTPEQRSILGRLETLLALVEGWVDEVTATTVTKWMPQASVQLAEAIRRRRATRGPRERLFSTLVGLDLSPRRVRDAANLWAAMTEARGAAERDAMWAHPDLMPTAEDLDDPLRLLDPDTHDHVADEMDVALAQLLEQAEQERGESSD